MRRVDDLQLKGLKIIQEEDYFCFGIDAVILSDFTKAKSSDIVVDIGCGNGILPLLLYGKSKGKKIIGVEIQSELASLAKENIEVNKLNNFIEVINLPIQDVELNNVDVIISNPPYMKIGTGPMDEKEQRYIARVEDKLSIDDLFRSAKRMLKVNGNMFMIHRADRIVDIFENARKYNLEPKEIRFVKSKVSDIPKLALIRFVKAGGRFLTILPELVIYDNYGNYTDEILRIYGKK